MIYTEAFAKLQDKLPTCILWLIDFNTQFDSLKATFSVYIPFLKPGCSGASVISLQINT